MSLGVTSIKRPVLTLVMSAFLVLLKVPSAQGVHSRSKVLPPVEATYSPATQPVHGLHSVCPSPSTQMPPQK